MISHADFESLHIPIAMKEGIITIGEWRLSPVVEVINELLVVDFDQTSAFLEESSLVMGVNYVQEEPFFRQSFQFSMPFFCEGLARKQQY